MLGIPEWEGQEKDDTSNCQIIAKTMPEKNNNLSAPYIFNRSRGQVFKPAKRL